MPSVVKKPYGEELLLTTRDLPYVGKIRRLKAGCRDSLQYHDQKTETVILTKGEAFIYLGQDPNTLQKTPMVINQPYTIFPLTIHRHQAITDCELFEISTPEIGTTFHLADDYQRPHETEAIRNLPNRGWTPKD